MLQPADARDIRRRFTTSPTARLETDTVSTPSVRSYRRRVHTRFLLETYSPRRPIAQRAGNGTLLLLPLFPSSLLLPTFMDQALDVKENVGCTPSRTVHGQNVAPAGARDIRRSFAIDVSFPLPPPQSNIGLGPGMGRNSSVVQHSVDRRGNPRSSFSHTPNIRLGGRGGGVFKHTLEDPPKVVQHFFDVRYSLAWARVRSITEAGRIFSIRGPSRSRPFP